MGEQDQAGFMKEQNQADADPIVEEGEDSRSGSGSEASISGSEADDDGQYKRIEGLPGVGDDEPQTRGANDE